MQRAQPSAAAEMSNPQMEFFLVGGAVRDELLGLEVTERDYVVVGGSEQAMLDAGYRSVGKDFPVFLHPESGEEYALARTERRTGRGHRAFECNTEAVTLEEDLTRRDLTINAIAQDTSGRLIDPVGGLEDLEKKQLRHISGAFAEDPLRILRVARFAARFFPLGFSIAEDTLNLMRSMIAAGELEDLTPERVLLELDKAMTADAPASFFEVLDMVGGNTVLWPALDLEALTLLRQIAALTGKSHFRLVATMTATPLDAALEIARRYRFPKRTIELLRQHREFAGRFDEASISNEEIVGTLYALDAFRQPDRFSELLELTMLLCRGDGKDPDDAGARWQRIVDGLAPVGRGDVDAGLTGPAIGDAIRAERIRRVAALR